MGCANVKKSHEVVEGRTQAKQKHNPEEPAVQNRIHEENTEKPEAKTNSNKDNDEDIP